jgi:hypothetical protein
MQQTRAATSLVDDANELESVFASVMEHALTTYGGRVKPEDVRSLVTTCYIQPGRQAA